MSEVKGSWKGKKAGGCFNHATWRFCPQYSFKLEKKAKVTLELTQENEHSAGFYVLKSDGSGRRVIFDEEVVAKSGFKAKKSISHEAELPAGDYIVVVSTFEPRKEGDFVLKASHGTLKRLRRSKDWSDSTVQGEWRGKTAGGCKDHKTFKYNQQFLFSVSEKQEAIIVVYQNEKEDFENIGFYVVKTEELAVVEKVLSTNIVGKGPFADGNESIAKIELEAGNYSLIPCTFAPEKEAPFSATIFSTDIRFVGDDSVAGAGDDDEAETPANKAPQVVQTASPEVELVREKKAHMETLTKVSALQSELEQLRNSNFRLQDEVKALQSGSGATVGSNTSVVDPKLMSQLVQELAAAGSDKTKSEAILAKISATLNPSSKKSDTESSEAASTDSTATTFTLTKTAQSGKKVAVFGEWSGASAAGCMNHLTWRFNPQLFLTVNQPTKATLTLTQQLETADTKPASISFYIIRPDLTNGRRVMMVRDADDDVIAKCKFVTAKSVSMDIELPQSQHPYVIIPATFDPHVERRWTFQISSESAEVTLAPFDPAVHAWSHGDARGEWTADSAGGCKNHPTFVNNPQYGFTVEKKTTLQVLMLQSEKEEFDAIGAYLIKLPAERTANTKLAKVANEDVVEKSKFGDPNENYFSAVVQPGRYVLIPCTFDPKHISKFSLHVFALNAGDLRLEELSEGSEVSVAGSWTAQNAGGCLNDESAFRKNQQYRLEVRRDMTLQIRLRQIDEAGLNSVGFYILKGSDKPRLRIVAKDILFKSPFSKTKDVNLEVSLLMGASPYIIVPCTFNKGEMGDYKLSLFAKDGDPTFSEHVSLHPVPDAYSELIAKSQWDDVHAGGCLNHTTWINNPQFQFTTDKRTEVLVFLSVPENQENFSTSIGFYMAKSDPDSSVLLELKSKDIIKKAAFRKGHEVAVKASVEAGSYNIIPATFKPGFKSTFQLSIYSDNKAGSSLKALTGGDISLKGKWEEHNSGGAPGQTADGWLRNPRYFLTVRKPLRLGAVLVQSPGKQFEDEQFQPIGFLVTRSDGQGNPRTTKDTDLIARAGFEPEKDVSTVFDIEPSVDPYVIVPSTFDAGVKLSYQLTLLVDPMAREFIELSDAPPTHSQEEWAEQFKAEALLSKMQKAINTAAASTSDLAGLVELASLDALSGPVFDLQNSVLKFQKLLNALKAAQLMGEEDIVVPKDLIAVSARPAGSAPPPPPPSSSGGPPPPPPVAPKADVVKGASYETPESELLTILKAGRAQLKSAADRKLADKPVEKDPFSAFNMGKILARRSAIEGEEEDEEDDDDWD